MPPEEMAQHSENPELEAMLMQREEHHSEMVSALETLIQQNEKNNPEPILEATLQIQDDTKKAIETQTEVLKEIKAGLEKEEPEKETKTEIVSEEGVFTILGKKGDKGEPGYTPVKGKDYFTDTEINSFKSEVTPTKGKDYFDGKDAVVDYKKLIDATLPLIPKPKDGRPGADAKVDYDKVVKAVIPLIPLPKNGKDGNDGSPDTGEDIVNKIKGITKEKNKLSVFDLKDVEGFKRQSSRSYNFTELIDTPNSYAGQSGKFVKVKTTEDGLEFGVSGGGTEGSIYNEEFTTDGISSTYSLSQTPATNSTAVYLSGARQELGVDYTVVGNNIVLASVPTTNLPLIVDYNVNITSVTLPINTSGTAGLYVKQYALVVYDFSVDGGAQGDIVLTNAPTIPNKAVVWITSYDVITTLDSATSSATATLTIPTDGNFFSATTVGVGTGLSVGTYTVGMSVSGVLSGGAGNTIKTTAQRVPVLTVGGENLTSGKVIFQLEYWISQ